MYIQYIYIYIYISHLTPCLAEIMPQLATESHRLGHGWNSCVSAESHFQVYYAALNNST